MTLLQVLNNINPGDVISWGNPDEADFVEIFVLSDCSLRFADSTMKITNDSIGSDKWRK